MVKSLNYYLVFNLIFAALRLLLVFVFATDSTTPISSFHSFKLTFNQDQSLTAALLQYLYQHTPSVLATLYECWSVTLHSPGWSRSLANGQAYDPRILH